MNDENLIERINNATGASLNENINDSIIKAKTSPIKKEYTEEQSIDLYQDYDKPAKTENVIPLFKTAVQTAPTEKVKEEKQEKEINIVKPVNISDSEIKAQEQAIIRELATNENHISTLQMLKEIVEKKDYDLLHMTDKEKLEARILRAKGLM